MTPSDPIPAAWHDELGHFIRAIFQSQTPAETEHWLHTLRDRYNDQAKKRRDPGYQFHRGGKENGR